MLGLPTRWAEGIMADSEWLQTLKCLDPHEPKNAEILQHLGVDQWRDRICSDPMWGSGKTQLYPNDLLTAYLLCLFGAVTFEQVCTHIDFVPDFWNKDHSSWPPEQAPLWLPGYCTFLTHLPNANRALEPLIKQIETRASESAVSMDMVSLLLLNPESKAMSVFREDMAKRKFEKERRRAIYQQEHELRRASIRELLKDWSYYPLLCSVLPQDLGKNQLLEILQLLDVAIFTKAAGLEGKFKTVEDIFLRDENFDWTADWLPLTRGSESNIEFAARWSIGCASVDPELPWRSNFADALEKLDASKANMTPSAISPLRFLTFCCLGPATTEFMTHQSGCLKAAAQRFLSEERPSSTHSLEDYDIIAEWDSSRSAWIVTWKDVFDAQLFDEKTKDLEILFDALATSKRDQGNPTDPSGQPQWKIAIANLVYTHKPDVRELSTLAVDQRVDNDPRSFAQDRIVRRQHLKNVISETEREYFGAIRQILYRGRTILSGRPSGKSKQTKLGKLYRGEKGTTLWTNIDPSRVFVNKSKNS